MKTVCQRGLRLDDYLSDARDGHTLKIVKICIPAVLRGLREEGRKSLGSTAPPAGCAHDAASLTCFPCRREAERDRKELGGAGCAHTRTHTHSHARTHTFTLLLRTPSANQHHPQTCPPPRGMGPSPLPPDLQAPTRTISPGPARSLTSAAPTHGHTSPHTPHFQSLLPNIQDLPSLRKPRLLAVVIKALGAVTHPRTGFPTSTPHTSALQATHSTTGRIPEMPPTSRLRHLHIPLPYTGVPQFTHPIQPSPLTPVD